MIKFNRIVLLILLILTGFPTRASVSSDSLVQTQSNLPHRIGVRVIDGVGEFYDTVTDEIFTPRGVNYLDFASDEQGNFRDSVLATDNYDPEKVRDAFRHLADYGYNTVRIFFDSCMAGPTCITDWSHPGLNAAYLDNMTDLLRIASEEGIYVQFTSNDIPDAGGYGDLANREASVQIEGYRNAHYLTRSGALAVVQYWTDLLTGLAQRNAPTEAVLGWQLVNEQWFFREQPPFSLTSGIVSTGTGDYDMSDPAQKQAMAVDNLLNFIEHAAGAIREHDPDTLVTIGFFAPQYPNETTIGGSWYVETAPLIERAPVDYFDFHAYTDSDLWIDELAENFGMTISQEKPVVMGEVSGFKVVSLSAVSQLSIQRWWYADSCDAGFDGWLHWGYYPNPLAVGGDIWALMEADELLFEELAPATLPDVCDPEPYPVRNVAYHAQVRASNQLSAEPAALAVDGTEWHFCAGTDAPQWIDVMLDNPTKITRVAGAVLQYPSGQSRQQVWATRIDGMDVLLGEFTGYTVDGTVVEFDLSAPLPEVVTVRFLTVESAGWPCWKELEVLVDEAEAGAACVITTAGGNVNLRAEPSTNADIVGTLTSRQGYITVANTTGADQFTWWQLSNGAWVREDVASASGECDTVPAADESPLPDDNFAKVTFEVIVPENTTHPVVVAGDFGDADLPLWDPGSLNMENTGSNRWQISLSLPVGTRVTYKYTRGSWESVEKGTSCEELDDRVLEVNGDITIADTVTMWRDLGGCD